MNKSSNESSIYMRISCLQIIESSLPSEATVFSMAEDDPSFILAFIFILFGMVNHVLVELIRRFIMSKPPGRRMVSLGKVVKATKSS